MTEERGNKRWKSEEVKFLRDNIDKSPEWLAEGLGRSVGSINIKSRKIFPAKKSPSLTPIKPSDI